MAGGGGMTEGSYPVGPVPARPGGPARAPPRRADCPPDRAEGRRPEREAGGWPSGRRHAAAELARQAGQVLRALQDGPLEGKELGAEGDRRSHELLIGLLAERFPGDRVRSEEDDRATELADADGPGVDHRPAGRDPRVLRAPHRLGRARGPGRRRPAGGRGGGPARARPRARHRRPAAPGPPAGGHPAAGREPDPAAGVRAVRRRAPRRRHGADGFGRRQDLRRGPGRGRGLRARRRSVRVGLVRPGGRRPGRRAARQPNRRLAAPLRPPRPVAARPGGLPSRRWPTRCWPRCATPAWLDGD